MAKPHALIGTWNYVNESKVQGISISGKIVYSDYGNFTLIIPTRNAFGDYKMESSFGSMKPDILTQCYPYDINQAIAVPIHAIIANETHDRKEEIWDAVTAEITRRYGNNSTGSVEHR